MPEIKIVTEIAGRVCATPVQVGGTVANGDEIVVVEAMKMEIPVLSPVSERDHIASGEARRRRYRRTGDRNRRKLTAFSVVFRDILSASLLRSRYGVAIA
ncbi:hypothetical protein ACVWXM_009258 [Bradyrhizobium sp. GM7.3]